MESYKDVILSQPPAMYQRLPQPSNVAVENYKGILLCACPVNIPNGASMELRGNNATAPTGPVFVPAGGSNTPLGLGPSAEERATMERNHRQRVENLKSQRANVCAVVSQHKRWLRSFAKQMRQMKEEEVVREVERARRVDQMRRKWAQKASEATAQEQQERGAALDADRGGQGGQQQQQQQQRLSEGAMGNVPSAPEAKEKKKVGKKKKKPKWALTEDEALEDEIAEADDLLEFAKNLDYDKFISDYEVAGALAIMRDRVEELTRENNWTKESVERAAKENADDEDEHECDYEGEAEKKGAYDAEARGQRRKELQQQLSSTAVARKAAPAQVAAHDKEWSNSTSIAGALRRAIMRDALQLAERILASSESMQRIHTKFSLARILQYCAVCGEDPREAMQKPSIGGKKGLEKEPQIVKLHPDATGLETETSDGQGGQRRVLLDLQRSKERTQGLPYLYRCPAI
ncbi:uncharacterized protein TEOVI_000344200 [Trypanosoma equiperdum]|uniref:Uncharacterized protein n=3 Tax=Trypanozoon TaxID=39700 RepID=Q57ZN8_TRYB2|nr:hypothetical protein, conserved [Trypanosoma brucei brucei TREU927]AAX79128.1 hypothetical protein, conserved [Trypanosoma brucei]AAZ11284.1 hypothetical protein, conserved [Trypanosoma brucei brucei TREU927]RHW72477.1 hypothetical protein DPX39_050022700 [Trypanosoma brucei equiperdum]SCU71860.1 hypothetical protein, conserved [Trypanosoma equiperdum]